MYLALKMDVIITLNVMGSVFKSFFYGKIKFVWHCLLSYSKICILIKQKIYQKDIVCQFLINPVSKYFSRIFKRKILRKSPFE